MLDAKLKGRIASGARHGMHRHPERLKRGLNHWNGKLTDSDVIAIRRACEAGENMRILAQRFGVSKPTICNVRKMKTHRNLPVA